MRGDEERWSANRWRGENRGNEYDRDYGADERNYGGGYGYGTSNYGPTQYGYGNSMQGGFGRDMTRDRGEYWNNRNNRDFDRDYRRTMGWGEGEELGTSRDRDYWNRDNDDRGIGEKIGDKVRRFFGKGPKGYKRSDDRIREDVCDRLSEGWIDASEIEVTVKDGEVTLIGSVTERRMKHDAEDLVERVVGVVDVHNQLRVKREDRSQMSMGTTSTGMSQSTGSNGLTNQQNTGRKNNITT
jgi:hypothetical protein